MAKTQDKPFATVKGIPDFFNNKFGLWGLEGTFSSGDSVPSVGMSKTYAVQLSSPIQRSPSFLWVQEGKITNLLALQPIAGKAVFDQQGRCLGTGGEPLEPLQESFSPLEILKATEAHQAMQNKRKDVRNISSEERVKELKDSFGSFDKGPDPIPKQQGVLEHRFHLRSDYCCVLMLPSNLTKDEAYRLSTFISTLPLK